MSFDPSAPATIGAHWLIAKSGAKALATAADIAVARLSSSGVQTLDRIDAPHTWAGPSSGVWGRLYADIYPESDWDAGSSPTLRTYYPNEDANISGNMFIKSGSWTALTATNGYPKIDDDATDSDYIIFGWPQSSYRCCFGSAGLAGTERVLWVKFIVRGQTYYGHCFNVGVDLYYNGTYVHRLGSLGYSGAGDDEHLSSFSDKEIGPLYVNPYTGLPWSVADVQSFDSTSGLNLHLETLAPQGQVSSLRMIVATVAEKRVGIGFTAVQTSVPSGVQTNLPLMLQTPAGVDNVALTAQDYIVVLRSLADPKGIASKLVPSIMWLGDEPCPAVTGTEIDASVRDASGLLTSVGDDTTLTYSLHLGTSGGAYSADSQPYYDVTAKACYATQTLKQFVADADGSSYGLVRFVVGVATGTTPAAPLLVKVKATTGGAQQGTTFSLDASALSGYTSLGTWDAIDWYRVEDQFGTAPTLAAATDYYIEWTSAAAAGTPWYIALLDATEANSLTGDATYNGSTDYGDVAGVAQEGDFAAVLSTSAAPPLTITVDPTIGGVGAGVGEAELPDPGNVLCDPGDMQFALLTWGAPSPTMGVDFLRYEIERNEDGDGWEPLATVDTENTLSWPDWTARRNVDLLYRARSVRVDGAVSDWATLSSPVRCTLSGSAILFTTNEDPSLCCGYILLGGEHTYDFLESSEVVLTRMHGRPYHTRFLPLEDEQAGVAWSGEVLIYTDGEGGDAPATTPPAGALWRAFTPLRDIARASLPYVAILTSEGERLYASLRVGSGRVIKRAKNYTAPFEAVQIADSPTVTEA